MRPAPAIMCPQLSHWVFSWLLVLGTAAGAASPARAVVVTVPLERGGWPEAERALEREFTALGVEVRTAPAPEQGDWNDALTDASSSAAAFAAVCVVRQGSSRSIYLWVRDAVTDKAVVRRLDTAGVTGPRAPVTLALKVIELLQASLLEVQLVPPVAPLPAVVEALVERPEEQTPTQSTRLALSWLSGLPPLLVVDVFLSLAPADWLELEFSLGGGLGAGAVSSELGAAQLGLARGRVALLWRLRTQGRLVLGLGAGTGLVVLMGQGRAAAPGLSAALDATAVGELFGRLRVDYQGDRFVAGAHVELGGWLPRTVVFLGGEPAAAWGFPIVSAGVSAGFRW